MAMPVCCMNSSPTRCAKLPKPVVPQLSAPGRALAWATNSLTVATGRSFFTTSTADHSATIAIGT